MSRAERKASDRRQASGRRRMSATQEEVSKVFFEWLDAFLRHKWMVIIPVFLCTGIAVVLALKLPPYYRSTTLIIVERQQVPEQYVTPADTVPVSQRLNTIKQQVMSRTNLEQIIKNFNLFKKDSGMEDLIKQIRKAILFKKDFGMEDLVEQMREAIKVDVIGSKGSRGGDAFTITYIGKSPQITMEITNAIASLFIEENLRLREQYAEGTSEFLNNELKKARNELAGQEMAVRKFKEEHMGRLPEQLDANLRTLDRLQMELQSINDTLINADNRKVMLEERISFIAAREGGATAQDTLKADLGELKKMLSSLLAVYKENYPDVIATKSKIKNIEKLMANKDEGDEEQKSEQPVDKGQQKAKGTKTSIDKGAGTPGTLALEEIMNLKAQTRDVRSTIKKLRKRESKTIEQIKIYEKRVEDIPANEQKISALLRNYEISKNNYQSILEKSLSARLAENLEKRQKGERFRIIDPANLPEKPFKPNRLMVVLLGVIAGAGFGAGFVYLAEFLNPTFRKPEDFEGVLPQPVFAVIPIFPDIPKKKSKT